MDEPFGALWTRDISLLARTPFEAARDDSRPSRRPIKQIGLERYLSEQLK